MNVSSKFNAAKNVVTSKAGRQVLKMQKHSPEIMFGVGVVGVVATVVLASKATLRLSDVLDEHEDTVALANNVHEEAPEKYSESDLKGDLVKIHVKTSLEVAKLYAPAFVVGVASIGLLTGAHVTLTRRNAGLVAAYAALDKGFRGYRERVIADVGEEKEREYYQGTEEVEIYSEKKNGEPVVKRVKKAAGRSPYAKFFDDTNPCWNEDPNHNIVFLRAAQSSLTTLLQSRGHVTLNDVYDQLCLPRTNDGMVVGWVKGHGDDFVDFGIWDDDRMEEFYDFMTGRERCIVLDFNVDGLIHNLI